MTDKCENCLSKNVCRWYENGTGKNLCCADDFPCPEQKDKDHFIKVPCKVGDVVWEINTENPFEEDLRVLESKVERFFIGTRIDIHSMDCFGKTVFLTKEQAEEKLKELKDNA